MDQQHDVVEFLSQGENWRPPVDAVERIQTHGSMIFLGGERALKMKRQVSFEYMDFSTLERRRRLCEAEVALNRRTAPELYLGTHAVTREADGRLALDGAGKPVEWLVEMVRFDQRTLFDAMARQGRLTATLIEGAADAIAAFHAKAEQIREGDPAAATAGVIETNHRCMLGFVPGTLPAEPVEQLAAAQRQALRRRAALISERGRQGMVRRCHGDLHLRNICLVDGRPTLFDCIEFNDAFAVIDVLYDIAFLVMDLLYRGLGELANLLLNRYLAWAGTGGVALLPLYLSMRAAVRCHVSAAIAAGAADEASAAGSRKEAAAYLELAAALLETETPRLLAVGGLSGSGKSTLARALAPGIGAPPGALVLRSDVIRKRLRGAAPETRLDADSYTREAGQRVYDEMLRQAAEALAAGHSVILDAVFADPAERAAAARLAGSLGLPFQGIWLDAPPPVLTARLAGRRGDASDATVAVLERQLGYELGPLDWHRMSSAAGADAVLRDARRHLATA